MMLACKDHIGRKVRIRSRAARMIPDLEPWVRGPFVGVVSDVYFRTDVRHWPWRQGFFLFRFDTGGHEEMCRGEWDAEVLPDG